MTRYPFKTGPVSATTMSSDSGTAEKSIGLEIQSVVQSSETYYEYLKKKREDETTAESFVVGFVTAVAALIILALGSKAMFGVFFISYASLGIAAVAVVGIASGLLTYAVRRRRKFPFAELGDLIAKMKSGGEVSSADTLKLVDRMHEALVAVKKGKVDGAFTKGIVAFILVALFGQNVAVGLLAGIVVYLYFRYEALKEYENEWRRYEESKKEFVESL